MCNTYNAYKTTLSFVGFGKPSTPAAPFGTPSPLGGGAFGTPGAAFGTPAVSGAGFGAPATPGGFGAPAQIGSSGFGAPAATPEAGSLFGGAVSGQLSALEYIFDDFNTLSSHKHNTAAKSLTGFVCCKFRETVKIQSGIVLAGVMALHPLPSP